MTAGQQRKVQRAIHVVAALALLAYVYAPLEAQLQDLVRVLVFPLLAVTGIAMWQAPRIRRALRAVHEPERRDSNPATSGVTGQYGGRASERL